MIDNAYMGQKSGFPVPLVGINLGFSKHLLSCGCVSYRKARTSNDDGGCMMNCAMPEVGCDCATPLVMFMYHLTACQVL